MEYTRGRRRPGSGEKSGEIAEASVKVRPGIGPLSSSVSTQAGVGIRSDLERLYREQGDRLWRAVFLYSGDRELAGDAVAEAFAQALRRGDSIESARSWVWHVSFRIAAGMLKDRRRTAAVPPEGTYQVADEAPDLTAALKTLPPKQRGAVVLRYYGGYSIKETAAILDSTPAAVGVHLTRGRRRLRTLLEERDA